MRHFCHPLTKFTTILKNVKSIVCCSGVFFRYFFLSISTLMMGHQLMKFTHRKTEDKDKREQCIGQAANEKKDRGKMMCMHLKLREERKKHKQQQQRHRRRRRVLSCGCLRFFWLIRWLFGFGAVSHSRSLLLFALL